jgi:protein-L-isoaspartate(D-aspartate) O-methyltransferase
MEEVPRHVFVPAHLSEEAYDDHPLPIGHEQTISQPYIVALMTELLAPAQGDSILEIGSGSGYQAALIAAMGAKVTSLERIPEIADLARENLQKVNSSGIEIILCDGTLGWPSNAPYDGIIITAATPSVPAPLLEQLAEGGRLVAPVGPAQMQDLIRLTKVQGEVISEKFCSVRFVPLIGEFGWKGF